MFICRQHLLRAFKQRYTAYFPAVRRYLTTVPPPPASRSDARPSPPPSDATATPTPADEYISANTLSSITEGLESQLTTPKLVHSPSRPKESDKERQTDVSPPAARDMNPDFASSSASKNYRKLLVALRKNNPKAVDRMMKVILDTSASAGEPHHDVALLRQILDTLATSHFFHRAGILYILQTLQAADPSLELPFVQLAQLTERFLDNKLHSTVDRPALLLLAPIITNYVLSIHADRRLVLPPYTRSRSLWVQFKMMMRLVQCQENELALKTLRQLVQYRVIPSSALVGIDIAGRDFGNIILTILIRCCASFGWANRPVHLLHENMKGWDEHISPAFGQTIVELIELLIRDATSEFSIKNAAALIVQYLKLPHLLIPQNVLIRFFERAMRVREDGLAILIYRHTWDQDIIRKYNYAVPHVQILFWLFRRAHSNKDVHTMRLLVKHVVEGEVELPEPARASFLLLMATHGMLKPARELWDRAVLRKDLVVLRDPGVLVRLVSLTQSRIRHRLRRLKESGRQTHYPASDDKPRSIDPASLSSLPPDASRDLSAESIDLTHDDSSTDERIEGDDEEHETASLDEEIQDYRAFADSVINTFIEYNSPLREASRQQLNALARAYIIRGRFETGTKVLRIVLHRKEIPDLHDANVALSALAARDPAQAAGVIDQMVSLGLQPDAVSFGTVINHAALRNDMKLVNELIQRARKLKIPHLSYKTVGILIRACVRLSHQDGVSRKACLKDAKDLIDLLLDAGLIPSSNMGWDCVRVALDAGEPVIAYNLWMTMIKPKVQWGDRAQAMLRSLVAEKLWSHWREGRLRPLAARRMFSELGHSTLAAQVPRAVATGKRGQ